MVCPKCGVSDMTTTDTLPTLDEFIFRRRKCRACDHRFKTVEVVIKDDDPLKYAFHEADLAKHYGRKRGSAK